MKHNSLVRGLIAFIALVLLAGCGGGGSGTAANPFAGGRSFYFSAPPRGGGSEWDSGSFEVFVQPDGSFESNGVAVLNFYTGATNFSGFEGDVTSGHINTDGSFVIEATINKEQYPWTPMARPYTVVASGRAIARGAHYEGTINVAYHDVTPPRVVVYDLSVNKMDRSKKIKGAP